MNTTTKRWVALLGAAATAAALAAPVTAQQAQAAEDPGSRFTVAVLPDTQFYTRYSADQFVPRYGTDPFEVQTNWLVDNAEELNIQFTTHLGDVVDQEWVSGEWEAGDRAMAVLDEAGMGYSVLPGNHDVADWGTRSSEANASNYLANFPASRLSGDTLVSSHQNGYSNAHVFEAEGQEFLVLAIGWNAEPGTWAWAQAVLDAHPTLPTILTSHAIIDIDKATGEATDFWFGQEMWEELIRSNDQIFLTLNGHFHGQTRRVLANDSGNDVHQILLDSQMAADGGNGIMAVMEFDLSGDRIDFATISPWVTLKDEETVTPSDTPVVSTPEADFSLEIDFSERFSFAEGFGPGEGAYGDLSERAKAIVSEGWDGDGGAELLVPAGARSDYIEVPGTLAHWRFGDQPEGVLPEDAQITDETGRNPMYRLPVDQINAPARVEDVTVTQANAPRLSADSAAVCFADASRRTGNLNYLTTEYDVPVTHAAFEDGYTIESYVYLSEKWTVEDNQWGGWFSRTGRRSALPVAWEQYDYDMGPAFFSVSNLREFQWATTNGTPWANTGSLWSGEIMTGNWYHVAAVNDPQTSRTTMYVDGVPVLRNATNLDGMTFAPGYPWVIGTVFNYDEASNGWNGCVGETRIVDHPIETSEFLYNRIDIDSDFAVTQAPSGELAAGTQVTDLLGTGRPGSVVRVADGVAVDDVETTVAQDGTWSLALDAPITASGSHELTVVPSLGTRDGEAATVSFSIAAGDSGEASGDADAGGDPGVDSGADGAADPSPGEGEATGADSAGSASSDAEGTVGADDADGAAADDPAGEPAAGQDGEMPATGLSPAVWLVLSAAALAIGLGLVVRRLRGAGPA
ncbi:metallophosphoesterase [Ruania suaedae]|uniref:LamG-like jellyroll fold domain-containing protein n=1 Tax=Ruania suaedae TaxID=2897774 RepID=UPI001E591535|nr:LamG-like jellyroll fold domain-containing protein [Ruania suaedae]UFU03245.1 metallophosphoesterase [Ruania suaedae]